MNNVKMNIQDLKENHLTKARMELINVKENAIQGTTSRMVVSSSKVFKHQAVDKRQASQGDKKPTDGSGSRVGATKGTRYAELVAMQRELEKARIREEILFEEAMLREVEKARIRQEILLEEAMQMEREKAGIREAVLCSEALREVQVRKEMMARGNMLGYKRSPYLLDPWRSAFMQRYQPYDGLSLTAAAEARKGALEDNKDKNVTKLQKSNASSPGMECTAEPEKQPASDDSTKLSGKKRTAGTATLSIPGKKSKQEWKCNVCGVLCYTGKNLEEHFSGKKHKAKEAKLKGLKIASTGDQGSERTTEQQKPNASSSGMKCTAEPEKQAASDDNVNSTKLFGKKRTAETATLSISEKKPKQEWKCEICGVFCHSEKNLEEHFRGKKHKAKEAKLKDLDGNSEITTADK